MSNAHQQLHTRLLDEHAMDEANLAVTSRNLAALLAQPDFTPEEAQAHRCEEQEQAAAHRDISKAAAEKEGCTQKDVALTKLMASRAAKALTQAGKTTKTDTVPHQLPRDDGTTNPAAEQDQAPADADMAVKAAAFAQKTKLAEDAVKSAAVRKKMAEAAIMRAMERKV